MQLLRCEEIKNGLRESEAVAVFRDHAGRRHFLRVERDYLETRGSVAYLPVWYVGETNTNLILIELPNEAETGVRRLWVSPDQIQGLPQEHRG